MRKEIIEYLYPLNQEETEALGNSMNIDRSIYMNGNTAVVRAEKMFRQIDLDRERDTKKVSMKSSRSHLTSIL